jgi:hypothetical protein
MPTTTIPKIALGVSGPQAAVPASAVAGTRYGAPQMATLDGEGARYPEELEKRTGL